MRPLRGDAALGRHARVAEPVRPLELAEPELLGERAGQPDLLVDLDHAARTHHPQLGMAGAYERLGLVGVALQQDHGMPRAQLDDIGPERRPVEVLVGGVERELAPPVRRRVPVDGDSGAVRAAIVHLDEHRRQVLPEAGLELRRLAEQPDDPAHSQRLLWRVSTYRTHAMPGGRPLFGAHLWRISLYLESGQVLADLPGGYLLVIA